MTTAALDGFAPRYGVGRWLAAEPFVLFRRRWAIWIAQALVLPRLLEGGRHA